MGVLFTLTDILVQDVLIPHVMGSPSLFVTIKTITTFAAKQKSTDENETYISEKLATRMGKVLNGELLAVLAVRCDSDPDE